jgi:competence protein ComEC
MGHSELGQQTAIPHLIYSAHHLLSAGSFALGIAFAFAHQIHCFPFFACTLLAVFGLTRSIKHTALQLIFFSVGYICLTYQYYQHKKTVTRIEHKTVDIEAIIESIEPAQHTLYRYIVSASVHKTVDTQSNTTIPGSWQIQFFLPMRPTFEIGDTVAFSTVKIRPANSSDFYAYLVKEHIHATVFLKSPYAIIHHQSFHLGRSIHAYKLSLLNRIRQKCSSIAFTLYSSIFIGNRTYVKRQYQDIKNQFHHWGIIHFLARSGLHLVIFVYLLQLLLQFVPIPLLIKHVIMLCATSIYALLSWQSISFARACATFGWYKLCHIAQLQINVTHIVLTLSCFFLIFNPSLLFALDFQLSFGLTLVLSLTNQLSTPSK